MEIKIPYNKNLQLPSAPCGKMEHFLWLQNGCRPESGFYLCYNEQALKIRLFSKEYPRFIKAERDDDAVWEDHCLEFFFAPFGKEEPYINFECNPNGHMIIAFGKDRYHRLVLTQSLKPSLHLQTAIHADSWEIEYTIPFDALAPLYGKAFIPEKGREFAFNAYVCGDLAEPPRYGVWSEIDLPAPDFHCPRFFGKGVLD